VAPGVVGVGLEKPDQVLELGCAATVRDAVEGRRDPPWTETATILRPLDELAAGLRSELRREIDDRAGPES
jgi:hypothetical protein